MIQVIHEFPVAAGGDSSAEARRATRQQLGIAEEALVVGMCGTPDWRKGADLFVQLAMQVSRRGVCVPCHFVWLGGNPNLHRESFHDIATLGLSACCHFVPSVSNPQPYLRALDVFALTSREDTFSVAMLEAAACGLPILCFADAGGGPEFVEEDAGIVVPYLDVPAMADACVKLMTNEALRLQMGRTAQAKVQANYTLAVQGPKIRAVIESALR